MSTGKGCGGRSLEADYVQCFQCTSDSNCFHHCIKFCFVMEKKINASVE